MTYYVNIKVCKDAPGLPLAVTATSIFLVFKTRYNTTKHFVLNARMLNTSFMIPMDLT